MIDPVEPAVSPAVAAEAADYAAEVLERDGWCQGVSVDPRGRVCFYGALATAAQELHLPYGAINKQVTRAAHEELSLPQITPIGIVEFNDAEGREAHEVANLFRFTAKRLRDLR
jgi:hypothetical protein